MESFGISFARGESFDDGALGSGFKFGVAIEEKIRRIRRWGRSEGSDGVDAQSWFIEEGLKGRSESFVTLGEEGSESLLTIRDRGAFVFERGKGAFGGFLVAKDLAKLLEVFGEFRVVLIKEFGAEFQPGCGRFEISLAIESKKDAFEESSLNCWVISDCELGEEEGKSFLTIHLNDAFKARLIEVNEGDRFGGSRDKSDVAVGNLAVVFPLFCECFWIEFSGVDNKTLTNCFGLTFWDFPVTKDCAGRADPELSVDSPGLGEVTVFWMVENGNVSPVVPSFDIHSNINPDRAFAFGLAVFLKRRIYHFSFRFTFVPGHAEKETTVFPFSDGDIGLCCSLPGEVEGVLFI